jgi:hypothetical protein
VKLFLCSPSSSSPRRPRRRSPAARAAPWAKSRGRVNAAKACKAQLALPEADFRAAHNGKSFGESTAGIGTAGTLTASASPRGTRGRRGERPGARRDLRGTGRRRPEAEPGQTALRNVAIALASVSAVALLVA